MSIEPNTRITVRRHLAIVVVCLAMAVSAAAQSRMDLDAFGRIVRVSDPQIAPDGRCIVVIVSRANFEENRFDADLVLIDVASGQTRTITSAARRRTAALVPAGDRLAFLAQATGVARPRGPKSQVFVMPMGGGDARRVTDAPTGVQHFAWSPDGTTIAFADRR